MIRFAAFEVDLRTGELRKGGVRIKVREQALRVLVQLASRPGELVSREELRSSLWPDGTVVDFEHSLNSAVNQLRTALGDYAAKPRFIETVPKRGYRFLADVETLPVEATGRVPRKKPFFAIAVAAVTGLFIIATVYLWTAGRRVEPVGAVSLAVLPLQDLSSEPGQEWLGDGLTEALTTRLASIRSLSVVSNHSARRFAELGLTVPEIAARFKVTHVLEGSVQLEGNQVRVLAQLIEAAQDHHIWARTYDRDIRDILALQNELARVIAGEVQAELSTEVAEHLSDTRPVSREAYVAYLKGRFFLQTLTAEGMEQGIEYLKQAVAEDPGFAAAYAELSTGYSLAIWMGGAPPRELIPNVQTAARKATNLDETLAETHAALGVAEAFLWNWPGAEREFRRAIELNPGVSSPHAHYAYLCLLPQGRLEEAVAEMRRALELDPLSGEHLTHLGVFLMYQRRYTEAIASYQEALTLDPGFPAAHLRMGEVYLYMKMYDEAVSEMRLGRLYGGVCEPCLAYALASAGKRYEAQSLLAKVIQRAVESAPLPPDEPELPSASCCGSYYVSPATIAKAYVALGDNDKAFEWLEKAYREQDIWLAFLKVTPTYDPLRSDPRYANLLRRINLQP